MVKCLAQEHSVMAGDSNPHSADQKQQSLKSVLLTAWPRHFHLNGLSSIHPQDRRAIIWQTYQSLVSQNYTEKPYC